MSANEITPDKQSVEGCLKQKTYYVDFYQREYVWKTVTVETLLKDIFYAFEQSYELFKDDELTKETMQKFNWYYLNVFITNNVDGKIYIVDGQQRLTTLTLIATKLYHMLPDGSTKNILKACIFAEDKYDGNLFCIDNAKRKDVMQSLLDNKSYEAPFKNRTEKNLIDRYKDISNFIDKKNMDEKKLATFAKYFLDRLVLVELSINKDDTPMVFEVINDRGEPLKPFEILKGKMVGLLSKSDTEEFSNKWDTSLARLPDMQDAFFRDYLKSRFIYSSNAAVESAINNTYHRYVFDNNEIAEKLAFRKSDKKHIENIKTFIKHSLEYYSSLYSKICNSNEVFLRYDKEINSLSGHYQNILAACVSKYSTEKKRVEKDPEEDEKIKCIARETDRLWVLMNLNGSYDSNDYQNYTYSLNKLLPGKDVSEYRGVFDSLLEKSIRIQNNLGENIPVSLLDYTTFLTRNYTNLNPRFLRYFFSRIEDYICRQTQQTMQNDVFYVSTKTGAKTGYHVEHILSNNDENRGYFESDEEFTQKRNLLGGLLLLKGLDNISSGNEVYADKLKTYSNGFVWGHSLCKDFYHANKSFEAFNNMLKKDHGIGFKSYDKFDKDALEERSKLLYGLVKIIWEV